MCDHTVPGYNPCLQVRISDFLILGSMTMIVSLFRRCRGISSCLRRLRRGSLLNLMRVGGRQNESIPGMIKSGRTLLMDSHKERRRTRFPNASGRICTRLSILGCISVHMPLQRMQDTVAATSNNRNSLACLCPCTEFTQRVHMSCRSDNRHSYLHFPTSRDTIDETERWFRASRCHLCLWTMLYLDSR